MSGQLDLDGVPGPARRRWNPDAPRIDYEAARPAFAAAGPWDRTVRYSRAAERLRAQGARQTDLRTEERAGVAVLVDTTNPNRIEAL